jgi:hypothetical protein
MNAHPKSGTIEVIEDALVYRSSDYGAWSVPLSTISRIDEFTTDEGPFLDDYFFRIHTSSKEERAASFYAEGWTDLWPKLARHFSGLAAPGLCNSTDFKVRTLWPHGKEEANQPVQRNASTGSVSNFKSPTRRG